MKNDGKRLEALVHFIEDWIAEEGAVITSNVKKLEQGVQIAEFDIVVESYLADESYKWLIECRDRPSSGPAPVSWIEQLIGRRVIHSFNKVTAVSTTGFSAGAEKLAERYEVELREVREFEPEQFGWRGIDSMSLREHVLTYGAATLMSRDDEPSLRKSAFYDAVMEGGDALMLEPSNKKSESLTLKKLFDEVLGALERSLLLLAPGEKYPVVVDLDYREKPSYFVDTKLGPMGVAQICFRPTIAVVERKAVVEKTHRYLQKLPKQTEISARATLHTQSVDGTQFAIEVHQLGNSSQIKILFDRVN